MTAYPAEWYPDITAAQDLAAEALEAGEQPSAWAEQTISSYNEWAAANPDASSRLDAAFAFQASQREPEAG